MTFTVSIHISLYNQSAVNKKFLKSKKKKKTKKVA